MILKRKLVDLVALFIFYSGVLTILNRFVNRFKAKRAPLGRLVFPFIKTRRFANLQVLVYHRVNDERDAVFPAIPTSVFAQQIEFLRRNFNVCSLSDAVGMLQDRKLPDNTIVVTLDDGYADNFTKAFPILRKHSIPATIFLAIDAINARRPLWHDRVFRAFRKTRVDSLVDFGECRRRYSFRNEVDKRHAQQDILELFWTLPEDARDYWVDQLMIRLEVSAGFEAHDLMLTWDQIRMMQEAGLAFGSHTMTHPILSRLSHGRQSEEIFESKRVLEEQLGVPVKSFAYPVGRKQDFNASTKRLLKEAGYSCALTTIFGVNECGQDLFELRRATPWEEEIPRFALKLNYYKGFA